jgi:putative membrane protein
LNSSKQNKMVDHPTNAEMERFVLSRHSSEPELSRGSISNEGDDDDDMYDKPLFQYQNHLEPVPDLPQNAQIQLLQEQVLQLRAELSQLQQQKDAVPANNANSSRSAPSAAAGSSIDQQLRKTSLNPFENDIHFCEHYNMRTCKGNCRYWIDRYSQLRRNAGSEARDHLANERTFLAWMRTSVAALGLGVAIVKLGDGAFEVKLSGSIFVLLGGLYLLYSALRYYHVMYVLDMGYFPVNKVGSLVIFIMTALATVCAMMLIFV